MANAATSRAVVKRNAGLSWDHLRKCETASARFSQHADATWTPSNEQASKMMFRQARCLRLLGARADVVRATTLVEQAAALAPNDMAIRDEKDAVGNWQVEVDEAVRVRQVQQEAVVQQRVSWWASFRAVVSELAS
jgi:hypothetical protein